jgi:hypothetical protein
MPPPLQGATGRGFRHDAASVWSRHGEVAAAATSPGDVTIELSKSTSMPGTSLRHRRTRGGEAIQSIAARPSDSAPRGPGEDGPLEYTRT